MRRLGVLCAFLVVRAMANKKLFFGGGVLPHDRSVAHKAFFLSIQACAPEVLQALWRDVMPKFKVLGAPPAHPFNEELVATIYDWAADFHLVGFVNPTDIFKERGDGLEQADGIGLDRFLSEGDLCFPDWTLFFQWVFFAAYLTLRVWSKARRKPRHLKWRLPRRDLPIGGRLAVLNLGQEVERLLSAEQNEPASTYTFECTCWNPRTETQNGARKRILKEVGAQLDKRLKQAARLYAHSGPLFGIEKAPLAKDPEHFDWLVKYQLQGIPFRQIAKQDASGPGQQAVSDGVKSAAQLVIGRDFKKWLRPAFSKHV